MEIQRSFLSLTAVALLISCGGKQSVASRSAAALQEAQKKGLPISGESHGGHAATVTAEGDQARAVDHSTMPGMDHSQMAGMDHGQMKGMDHGQTKGMGHSQMAGMDHGQIKGMDHSQMPSARHGNMAGMQHDMSSMQHGSATIPPGGLWGPVPGSQPVAAPRAAPVLPLAASPRLRADAQDAPAPVSVTEAQKAAGPGAPK